MKQYYESEVLFQLMERDGFNIPSSVPPYEGEIKAYLINQVKQAYPKLTDYEAEWLMYNYTKHLPAEFPISSASDVTEVTFENVVPFAYQNAILKGNTKYRDIDTGDILDTFDGTKNLELVSVKIPVLTTSNEDATKTNILTVNEEVELRGIGDVRDTLDLMSGEIIESIGEAVLNGSEEWLFNAPKEQPNHWCFHNQQKLAGEKLLISDKLPQSDIDADRESIRGGGDFIFVYISKQKVEGNVNSFKQWLSQNPIKYQYRKSEKPIKTVDLKTINEKGESTYFMPLEGTMHVQSSGEIIKPTFDMSVPVEATTQNLASFIDLEMGNNHE